MPKRQMSSSGSLRKGGKTMYPLVMTNSLLLKIAIEIVDLPNWKMVIFHSYVSLPESKT